jgi:HEPN domain-containing protein
MPHEESLYPADWTRIGEKDLTQVERLLYVPDAEMAGFCLQQAVEKFLKAFLFSKGWQLRRIHNLEALLDDAIIYDASLEVFRNACQKITVFYFVERYPLSSGNRNRRRGCSHISGASQRTNQKNSDPI